jgi:hypothetical protein
MTVVPSVGSGQRFNRRHDDAGRPRSNARNAQLRSSITLVAGSGENSDGAQAIRVEPID